jgi:AraC-like DNA-binding protein
MVLGQITEPFYIEPTGYVNTFAVCFYPYGFANFISEPIKSLANKETPLKLLFGEVAAKNLEQNIIHAGNVQERIAIIESFLLNKLSKQSIVDNIVRTTVDALLLTNGNTSINTIFQDNSAKRRKLERKFVKQVGISPKQLGKVIRLQAALKMMLSNTEKKLTSIAYESKYYDQAHFIKDFKEFTGVSPKEFFRDETMALSSLFYK